jgi:hypothetical protein
MDMLLVHVYPSAGRETASQKTATFLREGQNGLLSRLENQIGDLFQITQFEELPDVSVLDKPEPL